MNAEQIQRTLRALQPFAAGWVASFIPLAAPLTSSSWDGDAYSTTAKTKIDLSSVFGMPEGARAVLVNLAIRDSGSASSECWVALAPNATANEGLWLGCSGLANDKYARGALTVPCDENGDLYYQVQASGAATMDIWMQIWGYWV